MIQEKTYPRKNRLPVLEKVIVPRTRRSSAYVSHFLLPTDAQKEDVELLRIQVLGISKVNWGTPFNGHPPPLFMSLCELNCYNLRAPADFIFLDKKMSEKHTVAGLMMAFKM